VLDPSAIEEIVAAGLGITNLVARATARADELSHTEIRDGVGPLRLLVRRWRPAAVAFLGISTFRIAFERPRAVVGPQDEAFETARVWALPNPSGLNASYQQPALTSSYAALYQAAR
jgi:TDG/mug DNA glycosylase family protein